jgi:ring-1,2-phenylacetyl-CoA epoxidase subunit PaaC
VTVTATAETSPTANPLVAYLLRLADDNVVLGQRLSEYISRAPELEEDLAVANIALDHIGVARNLYTYAGEAEGAGRDEDDLAFLRTEREFTNVLLVEQPHDGFGDLIARQFLFDAYQVAFWETLSGSGDERLAGIAAKAFKEARYHLRHSSSWVVRLGDGTDESHRRMQDGIDAMWRFTGELFEADDLDRQLTADGIGIDPSILRPAWEATVDAVLSEATLMRPDDPYQAAGGRTGVHTEHLGHLLAEMQWMQRTYPGLKW